MTLDWKYPDLHADRLDWRPCQAGVDGLGDVTRLGYCVVAERPTPAGRFLVAVRDGWYWLVRHVPADRFDGVHLVEVARTAIPYGDDDEIVDPAPR